MTIDIQKIYNDIPNPMCSQCQHSSPSVVTDEHGFKFVQYDCTIDEIANCPMVIVQVELLTTPE